MALEVALLDPLVRNSPTQLADLIADDFVEFGASGTIFDKEQIIKALLDENQDEPPTRTTGEFKTRWLATDTALVTYQASRTGTDHNTQTLRASIWKYQDARWQMIFHQGTVVSH